MKKLIVMMLVLVAVIGGVFAADSNVGGTGYRTISNAAGIENLTSDNTATMTMKFKPVDRTTYVNFGFLAGDEAGVSGATNQHLTGLTDEKVISELTLSAVTDKNTVYGTGSFKVFYEVVTTENLKVNLSFADKFAKDSNVLGYTVDSIKTDANAAANSDIITVTPTDDITLYSGVTAAYAVKTQDASLVKNVDYTALVTLTLTANS